MPTDYKREFFDFAISAKALCFGDYRLKSGRQSPYFFNTGLFNTGALIARLGQFYARAIAAEKIDFDLLYGPAYKGIPLAVATAAAYAQHTGRDVGYVYNRKETKTHGDKGLTVGAPLRGKVLIVDDVISAGISINEAVGLIKNLGATSVGVVIALDRQERGEGRHNAAEEIKEKHGLQVYSIVSLQELIAYLGDQPKYESHLEAIRHYQAQYGQS